MTTETYLQLFIVNKGRVTQGPALLLSVLQLSCRSLVLFTHLTVRIITTD